MVGGCLDLDVESLSDEEKPRYEALSRFCGSSLPCPDCSGYSCDQHCVVLGKITVNEKGCLVEACANECRRYVPSGRMMQYLFTSLYAGVDKWATLGGKTLPSAHEVAGNPIHALCFFLQEFLFDGADKWQELVPSFIRNPEDPKDRTKEGIACFGKGDRKDHEPAEPMQKLQYQLKELDEKFNKHQAQQAELQERIEARVSKEYLDKQLDKLKKQMKQTEGPTANIEAPKGKK
jgi:hypothetical protein